MGILYVPLVPKWVLWALGGQVGVKTCDMLDLTFTDGFMEEKLMMTSTDNDNQVNIQQS